MVSDVMSETDPVEHPRVSVVVPCHNGAGWIAQTLGSLLDQTRPPAEVVVVDDGSTDDSLRVALRWRARHPGVVRVLSERSGRASATRNLGALAATGDALMFCDADDVLAPDTLAALVEALDTVHDGVAICPWYRLDLIDGTWVQGPPSYKPRRLGEHPLDAWLRGWYHPPCSVLWSREGFERAGRWDDVWNPDDDGDLFRRALAHGVPLAETDRGAAFYRRLPEGAVTLSGRRFSPEGLAARMASIDRLTGCLDHQGVLDRHRPAVRGAYERIAADAAGSPELAAAATSRGEALTGGRRALASERAAATVDRFRRHAPRLLGRSARPLDPARAHVEPLEVRHGLDLAAAVETDAPPLTEADRPEPLVRPTVSVVVPTHQRAHLLPRALQSVLAQTFEDLEVIVVDDGSTDGTDDVVAAIDDDRVRYLAQPRNTGVSAARNRGMRAARGRLVAFCDSDDEWMPDKLTRQVAVMDASDDDVGLVSSGVLDVFADGSTRHRGTSARGDLWRTLLERNVVHGTSGVVIRRRVIAAVGFFDEGIPAIEDYDYWVRIARSFRFEAIDEPLVRYHDPRHGDRKSLDVGDNHEARRWFHRAHRASMRAVGVEHLFLVESARRTLARGGDLASARRDALAAARRAPTSPVTARMLARVLVVEPVRRSSRLRGARRRLTGGTADPRRLRVLLHTSVSRQTAGGVQSVFVRLAEHLRRRGHVALDVWSAAGRPGATEWAVLRLRVPEAGVRPSPRAIGASLRSGVAALVVCARARPDVVNVHFVRAEAVWFVLLRPIFGYRLVLSAHGTDLIRPAEADHGRLRRLLRSADAVTAVSEELRDLAVERSGLRPDLVRVIPNGVDLTRWGAVAGVGSGGTQVLSVGRLTPDHKGQDVLLRAMVQVRDALGDVRLTLVGTGRWRDELEALTAELGLADAVTFAGERSPDELAEDLARADVFTLASRREGLPLALLEAMAAGVPVVATDVGSVAEAVTPDAGVVVAPDDPLALADALVRVLGDEDRRAALAAGARRRAEVYSSEEADAAYETLFVELAGGATDPAAGLAVGQARSHLSRS